MSDMTYALDRKFRARAEFDGPGSDLSKRAPKHVLLENKGLGLKCKNVITTIRIITDILKYNPHATIIQIHPNILNQQFPFISLYIYPCLCIYIHSWLQMYVPIWNIYIYPTMIIYVSTCVQLFQILPYVHKYLYIHICNYL